MEWKNKERFRKPVTVGRLYSIMTKTFFKKVFSFIFFFSYIGLGGLVLNILDSIGL